MLGFLCAIVSLDRQIDWDRLHDDEIEIMKQLVSLLPSEQN